MRLGELLLEPTGYSRVYFSNSGVEAIEAAYKLLRRWGNAQGRTQFISFTGGFHGRTMTGLSLMQHAKYREGFAPFLPDILHLPFNDEDALEAAVSDRTIAVVYECIQGEGGVLPMRRSFAERLAALRERYGFRLLADEIQTGMGRTGRFLAGEHLDLRADIVTLAKSLGGGLPLGATLVSDDLIDVFTPGSHGSTFGGNPLACAAGVAVMQQLENGLIARVSETGPLLTMALRRLQEAFPSLVTEVRGTGCMQALSCSRPAAAMRSHCLDEGLLINVTHENVIRLLPPLIIEPQHIEEAEAALHNAFKTWALEETAQGDSVI